MLAFFTEMLARRARSLSCLTMMLTVAGEKLTVTGKRMEF